MAAGQERRADWEQRLADTVTEWRTARRFDWAEASCAEFAAACVIAVTGEDPFALERPELVSERAALRLMANAPLGQRLDEKFPRIAPALAMRGDLVLTQGSALGVVFAGSALFWGPRGILEEFPRAMWQAAWAIGGARP